MKVFTFYLTFSLSIFHAKSICRVVTTFKKDCQHYDFTSENCYPWDLSQCPEPAVTNKWSHCNEYHCDNEDVRFDSSISTARFHCFIFQTEEGVLPELTSLAPSTGPPLSTTLPPLLSTTPSPRTIPTLQTTSTTATTTTLAPTFPSSGSPFERQRGAQISSDLITTPPGTNILKA